METDLRIPVNQSINADNVKENETKSECVDQKEKREEKKKRKERKKKKKKKKRERETGGGGGY